MASQSDYITTMTGSACEACSGRVLSKRPQLCDRHAGDWVIGFLKSGETSAETQVRLSNLPVASQSKREVTLMEVN